MATKKRKKATPARKPRKRMSGVSKVSPVEVVAFSIGGAFAGSFAKKLIPPSWGALAINGIVGGAPIAIAIMSPDTVKDPRALAFAAGMATIGGIGAINVVAPKLLSGIGSVSMIAGFDAIKQVAGINTSQSYRSLPTVGSRQGMVAGNSDFMTALAEDLE